MTAPARPPIHQVAERALVDLHFASKAVAELERTDPALLVKVPRLVIWLAALLAYRDWRRRPADLPEAGEHPHV